MFGETKRKDQLRTHLRYPSQPETRNQSPRRASTRTTSPCNRWLFNSDWWSGRAWRCAIGLMISA